jgi:DNA polymerase I-like protein with 3'-5' exonuclease and polymerase domains
MRHAIVASEGFVILAADYSQIELRILAHLSKDEKLTKILNDGQDVFKAIAAKWKRIEIEQVKRGNPKHCHFLLIFCQFQTLFNRRYPTTTVNKQSRYATA